ncbi:uncharacterized protein LOC125033632 [Penaeus chinensis]|uniref:uncharacterized protein LOC125033632 n=1 Tax=Penaeus chinensis TaxID=139456 RepID=UPI001FB5BB42|nr:uncharacterized protein LOC125033632 [Penaeus chinensis]XP_047481259.1 uncharacterized protein LOC125033632 [Penaeus chinensis]XP_047481260.1 uncharacterized protein LOC125033632 [Penaeus chinensis]XP_047481261.1 uncharacterized protein LOC125033632 [Penaeus chinensis]XP_047481262.1 uncharacterized protein LOC125033632 [Penaeus chinensis]
MAKMKAPSGSKKITKAWLEFMLAEYESKERPGTSVSVADFSVKQGIPPGEGFNSELVLVDITAELSSGPGDAQEKTYHLAAKFLHVDPIAAELNRRFQSHIKELRMYAEVVHELNAFLAAGVPEESQICIPKMIYGKENGSEYVLVMENIKAAGYMTNDKRKGLDVDHVKRSVEEIAKVHAVSYAYNKSHNFLEKFPCYQFKAKYLNIIPAFLKFSLKNCVACLNTVKGKEELAQKVGKAHPILSKKFHALFDDFGNECLCHGDFWNCNIMFKYQQHDDGQEQTLEGIKLIDWGNSSWHNPMIDLQYLLHTSTTLELRKTHIDDILQKYHTVFTSLTTKLGAPLPHYSYSAFREDWERTAIYGFILGNITIQGTLSTTYSTTKSQGPSILDHGALTPIRLVVNSIKTGMAKLIGPIILGKFVGIMLKPIQREILSGTNEVLNARLLDVLCEADEKGLFDE